jgi:hypothetical protein
MTSSPSLLANALHLRIAPPLRTLTHRRQLLASLQARYGDVLVYKSLCVRPLSTLPICRSNEGGTVR